MRTRILMFPLLVACDMADPSVDAEAHSPAWADEAVEDGPPERAARKAFEALPELPVIAGCTRRDAAVSLSTVDADGAACTACPWEETEVHLTIENGCEAGELALPLVDGCLDWIYKIRDELQEAYLVRGLPDCEDPGVDEVILAPGESWTEVVPVELDPDVSSGSDLTFQATNQFEHRHKVSFSLVED